MPKESEKPNFEAALKELEDLVEQMEKGELSLEESLKAFERGIELTRTCQKALDEAEQRIEILTGNETGLEPGLFGTQSDEPS